MKLWSLLLLLWLASCTQAPANPERDATPRASSEPLVTTSVPTRIVTAAASATPGTVATALSETLAVKIFYPVETTPVETGQALRLTAQVFDRSGRVVRDATMVFTIEDGKGTVLDRVEAAADPEGVYRSEPWPVPPGRLAGTWQVTAEATHSSATGRAVAGFPVTYSRGDILLRNYGFWIDAPTLGGIGPSLVAERGDARNGMIRWGGVRTAVHLLPAAWVEIHWRSGQADLDDADAVRRFLLADLGDIGFTPIRELGPFHPYQFHQWDGWRVGTQAQFEQDEMEWVVFYAAEVDKTFAIGTTVVLPPTMQDPHALLRDSFTVHPEIAAAGVAPRPLPELLPGPTQLNPALGERFYGRDAGVALSWEPLKELADGEYYEVTVDYNYREDNPKIRLVTRETEVTLPPGLYDAPNCHVFNWQVVLKRQTGVDSSGQPAGEALSHNSLYRYLWWLRPPGEKDPFPPLCPNAQF